MPIFERHSHEMSAPADCVASETKAAGSQLSRGRRQGRHAGLTFGAPKEAALA